MRSGGAFFVPGYPDGAMTKAEKREKSARKERRRLTAAVKLQARLEKAPEDPRAPRWAARLAELERGARIAELRAEIAGLEKPGDITVHPDPATVGAKGGS